MDQHSTIIQKLSEDMSYMRGRFDTAIPLMQKSADDINKILLSQDKRIDDVEKEQSSSKGKASVVGGLSGFLIAGIITWISKHF